MKPKFTYDNLSSAFTWNLKLHICLQRRRNYEDSHDRNVMKDSSQYLTFNIVNSHGRIGKVLA